MKRSEAGGFLWRTHRQRMLPWLVPMFFCVTGLPFFIFGFVLPGRLDAFTVSIYFVFLGVMLGILWKISTMDSRIEDGARGERLVGRELEKLYKEGFSVFHDYDGSGRGNVDHFIVGPPGIFTIETKAWKGEISSDGSELFVGGRKPSFKDPIKQVKGEAKDVSRLVKEACGMDIWVHPILCFSRAELRTHGAVRGVEVVDAPSINRAIMTHRGWRKHTLSPSQTRAITALLRKRLETLPAASPGHPPSEKGFFGRMLSSEKFYLGVYAVFFFVLSIFFAENTAAAFEKLAEFYGLLALL